MSESEEDNKQKKGSNAPKTIEVEIDNSEVITSEIIEQAETAANSQTVIVKKGSFLSFLAFILSASALTISAYNYTQQNYTKETQSDNKSWQQPLGAIEKSTSQKFKQLSGQISQLKQTNTLLQKQLTTIEEIAAKIQPIMNQDSANGLVEIFDDSQINQQIKTLQEKLLQQEKSFNELQINIANHSNQQNQTVKQLRNDIKSVQSSSRAVKSNYTYDLAESLLQAAHIQLSIHGNVSKTQALLSRAQKQLKQLSGVHFTNLAQELKMVADKLSNSNLAEIHELNNQIEALSMETAKLSFSHQADSKQVGIDVQSKQQHSSWFDKLIVIRKVDGSQQTRLSNGEQQGIFQNLHNHYEILKIALMTDNQNLWINELTQIEDLLNLYFLDSSESIKAELSVLKGIDINPVFPELGEYLQKLKGFNNNNSTEPDTEIIESL